MTISRAVRQRLLDLAPLLTLRWVTGPLAGEKVPETGRHREHYMADTGLLSVASLLSDGAGFNLLRYYDIERDIMLVLPVGEGVECMKRAALVHHFRRILKANPCLLERGAGDRVRRKLLRLARPAGSRLSNPAIGEVVVR